MPTEKSQAEVFQDDIHALLKELGLGNHARTESPHQVLHQEIIPAIKRLKREVNGSSPSSAVAQSCAAPTWNDEPPPDPAGQVKTRYRSTSVHGGWVEETIQIYTVFGGGTTRKYYRPETEETGPLSELENRQWKY